MEASITLKKVGKLIGDKTILAGLTFGVERGTLVAIVGVNDAGKSTLIKLLSGFENPNYGQSGIHPTLQDLPDEHNAHPKKVKQWIKTQKELASAERAGVRQGIKGAIARLANHEGYIRNCQKYLRDGDWVDDFFGEHQERKIQWRCLAMAYDQDGETKRKVGTYYPDIGMVYEGEVSNKDKGIENVRKERKSRKRSNNSRTVEKKKTKKT